MNLEFKFSYRTRLKKNFLAQPSNKYKMKTINITYVCHVRFTFVALFMFKQKHFKRMMAFCRFVFGDLVNFIHCVIHFTDLCSDNNGYLPIFQEGILLDKCNGTIIMKRTSVLSDLQTADKNYNTRGNNTRQYHFKKQCWHKCSPLL